MAMFHLLKIRKSIDIFKNEKCKVTFGLEYKCFSRLMTSVGEERAEFSAIDHPLFEVYFLE